MAKPNIVIPVRERLQKLYEIGVVVDFEDEDGSFSLWVRKPTSDEVNEAIEHARESRTRISSIKRMDNSDPQKLAYYDRIDEMGLDKADIIDSLNSTKLEQRIRSARSEVAHREEWSDEDYLSGLQEAWSKDLYEVWEEDPENPEAKRVFEELMKYEDQVLAELEPIREELARIYEDHDIEALKWLFVDKMIDRVAEQAMLDNMIRYQITQVTYAIDNPEDPKSSKVKLFDDVSQLSSMGDPFINKLTLALNDLTVDYQEGKD